ncbi:MAG: hypothetical protein EZS28_046193 [Streblomastix strix]|uniref:Uncharacterized protein n=1 Tax=Streblomastix strix TaxID=222440 RepID=A0A5J4TKE5_9EUKA|nr:MAG: hypothetical protein EZS28_046193 [Streblomastix strix]
MIRMLSGNAVPCSDFNSTQFSQNSNPQTPNLTQKLFEMNIFPVLLRLIDQPNSSSSQLSDTVKCIFNLLFDGLDRVSEQTVHPYFQELSRCGGVEKLWQLFIERRTLSIQQSAAISLTYSFRSSPLPPQFALIIGFLISQIGASGNNGESTKQLYSGGQSGKDNLTPEEQRKRDMSMIINALAGLSCLADHQANHAEIMNNSYLHVVMEADPTGTKSITKCSLLAS